MGETKGRLKRGLIWGQICPLIFQFLIDLVVVGVRSDISLLGLGRAVKQTGFQIRAEL